MRRHSLNPFAEKFVHSVDPVDGEDKKYKLYKSTHGKFFNNLTEGQENVCDFTVPFRCKFEGMVLVYSKKGDKACVCIHDDANGTYTGTPNMMIPKTGFGNSVCMAIDKCEDSATYDAELMPGMVIKVKYTPSGSGTRDQIGINYKLHEMVEA